MSWIFIVLAGLLEVLVVVGIRLLTLKKYLLGGVIYLSSLTSSLYFLSLAMRELDMSISYAAYTGIGIVGTAIYGMLFCGDKKSVSRGFYITLIVGSVCLLKLAG